jgi:endonuclease/exonuclease/phosphatase family metal-dependent hydrolase
MQLRTLRRGRNLVIATATLGLLGLPLLTSPAEAAPSKSKAPAIKVMTRNVYLGADIMRPLAALQRAQAEHPDDQIAQLNAFANANDVTRDMVDTTNFPARAELLASELAAAKPDLVGLQEVALFRSGEFQNPLGPEFLVPNATTVDLDFLKILLAELKAQGTPYKALSVNTLSDVEAPAYEGRILEEDFKNARDVRITMRDVILQRKASKVKFVKGSAREKVYDEKLEFAVSGKPLNFDRGYQWVDMVAGKKKFRFVNTHFEAFGSDIAYAQAEQLVAGPAGKKMTTILSCDCNSDPANGSIKTGDTKRHWAPYFLLKRSGGFNDTWLQWAPPEEGFTSGLEETVDDAEPSFTHRIDLILARTKNGSKLPVLNGDVTGNEVEDKAENGLWPSDHAGVVMRLRLR